VDKSEIAEKTKRAYDKIGSDYDNWYWMKKSKELRADVTREVMGTLSDEIVFIGKGVKGKRSAGSEKKEPNNLRILDLCCGTGHLYNELSSLGQYAGLDFAPSMIKHCKSKYPNGEFVLGNAEKMPFPDNSFDVVICFWSFHHFVYPQEVLDEIKRVLKPTGFVLIVTFKDTSFNPFAFLGDKFSDAFWGFTTNRYSKKEMVLLMKGFKSVKIQLFPRRASFLGLMGIRFMIVTGRK